jgi:hypothetical protein
MQFGAVHENFANQVFPANTPFDYGFYVVDDDAANDCSGQSSNGPVLDAAVDTPNSTPWTIAFASSDPDKTGSSARSFGYPGSVRPCFSSCFDPVITTEDGDLWLPSCGMGGGSSGGAWAINFDASSSASQNIISVNSWGYTNYPGMGGAYLNSACAESVFNLAKSTSLNPLPTEGGVFGSGTCSTTAAPSSCNYKNSRPCQNNGCCWNNNACGDCP